MTFQLNTNVGVQTLSVDFTEGDGPERLPLMMMKHKELATLFTKILLSSHESPPDLTGV